MWRRVSVGMLWCPDEIRRGCKMLMAQAMFGPAQPKTQRAPQGESAPVPRPAARWRQSHKLGRNHWRAARNAVIHLVGWHAGQQATGGLRVKQQRVPWVWQIPPGCAKRGAGDIGGLQRAEHAGGHAFLCTVQHGQGAQVDVGIHARGASSPPNAPAGQSRSNRCRRWRRVPARFAHQCGCFAPWI